MQNRNENTQTTDYTLLVQQLEAISEKVTFDVTILANAAALLWDTLPEINWAGFYLMRDGGLLLGPFQGKPACTQIAVGRGVCGTAVKQDAVQRVPDVHQFPGHIACDSASRSEIVLPIHLGGQIYGVLDIDSPIPERFSPEDQTDLGAFAQSLEQILSKI